MITMWGQQPLIRDYSRREWSGMLNGFYLKRWEKLYAGLSDCLASGKAWDSSRFDRELQKWELDWAKSNDRFQTGTRGDTLSVSRRLWKKYESALAKSFAPESSSLTTGKPTTASSTLPGHPASLRNDGRQRNTDRYWATDISTDPDPWWQVDLEKPTASKSCRSCGFLRR